MLLVPRTPSPPPPPPRLVPLEERPVESLSVEELQQLVRRQRVSLSSGIAEHKTDLEEGESHR